MGTILLINDQLFCPGVTLPFSLQAGLALGRSCKWYQNHCPLSLSLQCRNPLMASQCHCVRCLGNYRASSPKHTLWWQAKQGHIVPKTIPEKSCNSSVARLSRLLALHCTAKGFACSTMTSRRSFEKKKKNWTSSRTKWLPFSGSHPWWLACFPPHGLRPKCAANLPVSYSSSDLISIS